MKAIIKLLFLSVVFQLSVISNVFAQTPTTTGLVLRLRADNGLNFESGVSAWADMSGNNHNATQTDGAVQPLLEPGILNGQPVIRFDGASQYMNLPTPSVLGIQNHDFEIFVVAQAGHDPGVAQFLIAGAFERYELHLDGQAGIRFIPHAGPYLDKGFDGDYTDNKAHIFSVRASATNGTVRVDGIDGGTENVNRLSSDNTSLSLGCRTATTTPGSYLLGDIAEVLIYNRVLTPSERADVEAYAAARYGITTGTLPVEMSSLSSAVKDFKTILSWETATEINNYGFEIERAAVTGKPDEAPYYVKAGFVNGSGNSNSKKTYTFTDQAVNAGSFLYRIKQVDINGTYKYYGPVSVNIDSPAGLVLFQNSPNPFNPVTAINYNLPKQENVTLRVYDQLGRLVNTLADEVKPAGSHTAYWNGRDSRGNIVSSGVYLYRLSAGEYSQSRKMNFAK